MQSLLGCVFLLLIVVAALALLALGISMIRRDAKHGTSGSLSAAALELQSLLEPPKKKVVEAQHELEEVDERDEATPGGAPSPTTNRPEPRR
ncbi:MAG: hypothetical protein DMF59_08010 [Acidobacteria bacterium]|nr:MAG: hypothetical protein DMF59_08010 [Acidobacteriota bacterium]